LLLCSNAFIVI